MAYKDEEFEGKIPDDFILDITQIPGSSDDVTLKAIDYYKQKLDEPDLAQSLKDIAKAFVVNLTEYYEMSNFESQKLRDALPFLSESARFMEKRDSLEMDVEPKARIKSLYSAYKKILDLSIVAISKNQSVEESAFLQDIYATRDILSPRHDMRTNPQAFYKLVYRTILEYMEFIDELHEKDPEFYLLEFPEYELKTLTKPQKIKYAPTDIDVPDNDFIDYALEHKKIPLAYRYLADIDNIEPSSIKTELAELKKADISKPETYSHLMLYQMVTSQVQKETLSQLRSHFDNILFNEFDKKSKDMYADYCSLPLAEFLKEYEHSLSSYHINCCRFLHHLDSANSTNILDTSDFPQFNNKSFMNDVIQEFNKLQRNQKTIVLNRLSALRNLDLKDFEVNLEQARKIKYFARCGKDYMKNPKGNGYQSFHMRIHTPYGIIEKQIRTDAQDIVAEKGPASHSASYKPNVRTSFHRLKVPAPLSPKRDQNGELIEPTELGILPFDIAVAEYYGSPFSAFAGKTFNEFKAQFSTKKEFDEAMLALSPTQQQNKFLDALTELFSTKHAKKKQKEAEPTTIIDTTPVIQDIPQDIAVYAASSLTSSSAFSTDDTDPHDNR